MNNLNSNIFEYLYVLESDDLFLAEIKRNDLGEYAAIGERFQWLRVEKSTWEISKLTFRSMDSSEEIEERYFEEGFLKFNPESGTYIEKFNSAQHALSNVSKQEVPNGLNEHIRALLLGNVLSA
ncbi:hypothetical protein [Pedobacter nanyangensis]|uniref:hypothetical protein n=1 Tax=Pedobacter nanyangensis TaxID=1562389 RepID=UPI000DE3BA74|nr:hypothetical protein [Pedobacter nanyangensis]